jgi:H+/Cl- antiporter ClcA
VPDQVSVSASAVVASWPRWSTVLAAPLKQPMAWRLAMMLVNGLFLFGVGFWWLRPETKGQTLSE